MWIDSNLLFDPANTAITASAASTNIFDAHITGGLPGSPAGRDLGPGKVLIARVVVQQTFTAAGAATLQVQLQAAPDSSGSPGTYVTLSQTDTIGKAALVAGAVISLPVPQAPPQFDTTPPFAKPLPRFYRLNYVVATGPMTAGQVQSFLTDQEYDLNIYNPNNFTVV